MQISKRICREIFSKFLGPGWEPRWIPDPHAYTSSQNSIAPDAFRVGALRRGALQVLAITVEALKHISCLQSAGRRTTKIFQPFLGYPPTWGKQDEETKPLVIRGAGLILGSPCLEECRNSMKNIASRPGFPEPA